MEYRGKSYWIGRCPNGCFEKMIDQLIQENTVEGVEPVIHLVDGGRVHFEARRYSLRNKRHAKTAHGHYAVAHPKYCPICGAKLEE